MSVDALANGVDPSIGVQTPVLTPQSKESGQDIARAGHHRWNRGQRRPRVIWNKALRRSSNADLEMRLADGPSQKLFPIRPQKTERHGRGVPVGQSPARRR